MDQINKIDLYELQARLSPLQTIDGMDMHYASLRDRELERLNDIKTSRKMRKGRERIRRRCLADRCKNKVHSYGYCRKHVKRILAGLDVNDEPFPPGWFKKMGIK